MVFQIGPVDCKVHLLGRQKETRMYHMNLLKFWKTREGMLITPYPSDPELGPQIPFNKSQYKCRWVLNSYLTKELKFEILSRPSLMYFPLHLMELN